MDKYVQAARQPNGDLYDLGWYLYWTPKAPNEATLDGEFTAQQLRDIADVMEGKANG